MNRFHALLAAAFIAATTLPAQAAETVSVKGESFGAIDVQAMSLQGLVAGANYDIRTDSFDMTSRVVFVPTNFTRFFTGEVALRLAPDLTGMLPVDIRPIAGLAGGMYIDDAVAPTTGSSAGIGTANAYIALPVGARFTMPLSSSLAVSLEGLYNFELFQVMPVQLNYSVSRLHLEAAARTGSLVGAVYYDSGATWSGPGAKVGLNF